MEQLFPLNINEGSYNCPDSIHGIKHTYRVMVLSAIIGQELGKLVETEYAVCSALIHDMARKHDGYCTEHGKWSVESKFPLYVEDFRKMGINQQGLEYIKAAVVNHCLSEEMPRNNPHYITTAILKDADALDRVRISETSLNTDLLRFPVSRDLIELSGYLYHMSEKMTSFNFRELYKLSILMK